MNEDWFAKLKEYDSLIKMKSALLKSIKDQEDRLTKLNDRKKDHLSQVSELHSEHSSLQQQYFETEKKMNLAEEQAGRLRDIGGDQEKIGKLTAEAAELENELFELLERTEAIQQEVDEKKTFLSGLEKTYLEIEAEVMAEKAQQLKESDNVQLRLRLIEDELPSDFRSVLERTLKKNLAIGPFTRTDNGSCFFCRYRISKQDESEIDMQKILRTCPQCQRIFLPYGI